MAACDSISIIYERRKEMVDYYFRKAGSSYYGYGKESAMEQYIANEVSRYYAFNRYPLPLDEHFSPDNPYLGKVGYHVQFPDWVQKAAETYGPTHKIYRLKKPYNKDEYMLEPVSYGDGYSDPYYCMETALERGQIAIVKGNNAEALYFYMGKYFMSEDELMQDVKDNPDLYAICIEIEHASVDVVIDAIKRWHVREWGDEGAPIVDYEQIGLLFLSLMSPILERIRSSG